MSSTRCYFTTNSICNGGLHFFRMIKLLWSIVVRRLMLGFILKRLSKFSIIGLLLFSGHSFAIGMSDLSVSSAVGERFYGLIAVTGAEGVSTNDMLVSVAPRSVYRAMGVEWEYFHSQLIFDVLVDDNNQYTIRVVSRDVVFEPYLDFVVSLRSPVGSISKQLTVLLEMPAVIVQPSMSAAESKPISEPVSSKSLASKTLKKIKRSPIVSKTEVSTVDKTLAIDSDKKPAPVSSVAVSDIVNEMAVEASVEEVIDEAIVEVVDEVADEETLNIESQNNNTEPESWLHKTRSGDSLWAVARRVQAETGGKIKPIVEALYQNNSHAFIKNDIDRLKIDVKLAVSAAQIRAVIAAGQQADQSSKSSSLVSNAAPLQLPETSSTIEEGVLSLVTSEDINTAAIAAETLELSERSDALANDFDKGLGISKERELRVEARMDNLYQQYDALAKKTEQLKVLEQSLNRSIADKSQLNMALDESLSSAANNNDIEEPKPVTDKRQLVLIIFIAAVLLLLLVLLLKRRQTLLRGSDIDNWSLDAEQPLNPEAEDSPELEAQDIESLPTNDDSLLASDSPQHEDFVIPSVSDLEVDAEASAIPAEGAVELEAAVYIAYERFDEAEDLLEQALEIESDNEALQMQLLEVYAAKGKTRHFDLLAKQIASGGGEHDSDKIALKINYLKSRF